MARNRYEEGYGVARLRWKLGEPDTQPYGTVLVEVWSSALNLDHEAAKPRVEVRARVEMRRYRNGEWQSMSFNGEWAASAAGRVRRHAHLPSRNWYGTVALDGWGNP